jgi:hypothetical protein
MVDTALGFTPYNATNPSGYITGAALPTRVGQLTNDTGYITATSLPSRVGQLTNDVGYITGTTITGAMIDTALGFTPISGTTITASMVTSALTFTPYNATNPAGYISSISSGNVITALGYTPVNPAVPNLTSTAWISTGTIGGHLIINANAGNARSVAAYSNGVARWDFGCDGTTESGSNAGSNFYINSFTDGGTFSGTALSINRATGVVIVGTLQATSINSSAITGGLGYTPVNKAGDTVTGNLTLSSTLIGVSATFSNAVSVTNGLTVGGITGTGTTLNIGTPNGTSLQIVDNGTLSTNYVFVRGMPTGSGVQIGSWGLVDANIDVILMPKGTGLVRLNNIPGSSDNSSALASTGWVAAKGYITGTTINSSMVTTALGYTPVNKAGDTMTGGLVNASGFYGPVYLGSGAITTPGVGISVTTSVTTIDTFATSIQRAAKYVVSVDGSAGPGGYQMTEVSVIHDGTNVYMTEYGQVYSGAAPILTISASLASGTLSLTGQSASGTVTVKFVRTVVSV